MAALLMTECERRSMLNCIEWMQLLTGSLQPLQKTAATQSQPLWYITSSLKTISTFGHYGLSWLSWVTVWEMPQSLFFWGTFRFIINFKNWKFTPCVLTARLSYNSLHVFVFRCSPDPGKSGRGMETWHCNACLWCLYSVDSKNTLLYLSPFNNNSHIKKSLLDILVSSENGEWDFPSLTFVTRWFADEVTCFAG